LRDRYNDPPQRGVDVVLIGERVELVSHH